MTTTAIPELSADDAATHVADLVSAAPIRAAVFERLSIDYCCGGKLPLAEACAAKGLDVAEVLAMLNEHSAEASDMKAWDTASIAELVAHIVDVHHGYLRDELPRVTLLAHKVARAHGQSNPALVEASREVDQLVSELRTHMDTEEDEVFPICVAMENGDGTEAEDIGRLVGELVHDHSEVAGHLERLRALLADFVPPYAACTSYRAYLDALERLELDIHTHVHKENHILFGKVMELSYA